MAVPASVIAVELLRGALLLLTDPGRLVPAETSTSLQALVLVAVAALLPMGLGALLIQTGGGTTRRWRTASGLALVAAPLVHVVLVLVAGLAYYRDPPWPVPAGESDAFLVGVGLMVLVAVVPIGAGIALLRGLGRPASDDLVVAPSGAAAVTPRAAAGPSRPRTPRR